MRFKEKQFPASIQVWWKEYMVEGWAIDLQSSLESWKRKYRLGQKSLWVAKAVLLDEIQGLDKKEESNQLYNKEKVISLALKDELQRKLRN